MATKQWILKLLSGSHQGAEMDLDDRTYLMGGYDDCDIVLQDDNLPDQLLSITVEGEFVILTVKEQCPEVFVNGKAAALDSIEVAAFDIVSVGGLSFCFGIEGIDWPTLVIPECKPDQIEKVGDENATGKANAYWYQGKSRRSKVVANIAIIAFFVVCGLVFNNGKLDADVVTVTPEVDLTAVVNHEMGFSDLRVSQKTLGDGRHHSIIKGYVKTQGELSLLKRRVQAIGTSYTLNIRTMEDIKRSTETLLKEFGLSDLAVSYGQVGGELMVSGVHHDPGNWQRVKKILLSDIPGLVKVSDQVESQASRLELLKQWIAQEGLQDGVNISFSRGQIRVMSDIPLEQSSAWQRVQNRFKEQFGDELTISVNAAGQPNINIRSVSLGEIPYLILANGRRYALGAHIHGGFYVDKIDKNTVVFKRGDELIKYRVGMGQG